MKDRFYLLWMRRRAESDCYRSCCYEVMERYSEPHRAYHTLDHIEFCLTLLDSVQLQAYDPDHPDDYDAIATALWYHDVVYDTHAKDNEEKSVDYARGHLASLGCTSAFLERVIVLIMATKHNTVLTDNDEQLIADIDLASLGQDEATFDAHNRAIRKEYEWVPEADYIKGRTTVLQSFLDKPNIFYLPYFREWYEARARMNLSRAIAALNKPSAGT